MITKRGTHALFLISLFGVLVGVDASAAGIVIDDSFDGSSFDVTSSNTSTVNAGVLPGWTKYVNSTDTSIDGWRITRQNGVVTLYALGDPDFDPANMTVVQSNATFNPSGSTINVRAHVAGTGSNSNSLFMGTYSTSYTYVLGWRLNQNGSLAVSARIPGVNPATGAYVNLPSIPNYSGGSIPLTFTANAEGFRIRAPGYDSGFHTYSEFTYNWLGPPGTPFDFNSLSTTSRGSFMAALEGANIQLDKFELYTTPSASTWSAYGSADNWSAAGGSHSSGSVVITHMDVAGFGTPVFTQSGGTVTVLETLNLSGWYPFDENTWYIQDGVYNLNGGTLDARNIQGFGGASPTLNVNGGTLHVDNIQGVTLINSGTTSPGHSPGLMEVSGDFTQTSAGTLLIELAGLNPGTEYDRVDVSGTANLDGILDIDLLYGFVPAGGNSFDILMATVINGAFGTMLFPDLPPGLYWDLQYLLNPSGTDIVRLNVVDSVVPISASIWLFGSAVGLLGLVRRKASGD